MIKSDFYPGVSPYMDVELEWTNNITDLSQSISTEPFKAYYMGTTPEPYLKLGTFSRTGDSIDNYVYHITVDNERSVNHWFYAAKAPGYSGTTIQCSDSLWYGSYRLLNTFKPYYYNHLRSVNVTMTMYDYSSSATLTNGETIRYTDVGYNNSNTISLSQDDLWNIFNGSGDITAVFNSETYHIKISMWDDTVHAFNLGGTKYAFVKSIDDGSSSISPTPGRNGVYFNNTDLRIAVFNSIDLSNETLDSEFFGKCYVSQSNHSSGLYEWTVRISSSIMISPIMLNRAQRDYRPGLNRTLCGWFYDTDISYAALKWATEHGTAYILTSNGTPLYDTDYEDIVIKWGIDFPVWFSSCYGEIPKDRTYYDADGESITPNANTPFYESYNAVPVFNINNVFQYRTKQKTYDNLVPLLQPWQKYGGSISDDTFDPDNPDPGEHDRPDPSVFPPGENVGTNIDFPDTLGVGATLGFVTQYCLNAAQISELGHVLWTSFTDQDYWKNFMFSLALDTGSFNTSSLLDYFISLRVYPFSLINVPTYAAYGQDMYIGSGYVPLHFTTALHTINNYAEYIDAGKVKLPFVFGDFRDCQNIEIVLYLPFCGTVQLEPAEVLGGTLKCKYAIDFATGACTACVRIDTWDGMNYPIAILPGNIGADVPLSSTNSGQIAARLGSDVINVAGILAAGAAGIADSAKVIGIGAAAEDTAVVGAGIAGVAGSVGATAAGAAQQGLTMAGRAGIGAPSLSGGRGFSALGCPQKCYVQIRTPMYNIPDNYKSTAATPAAKAVYVKDCKGLARFINPDVSKIDATDAEKNQIRAQLQAGIIV